MSVLAASSARDDAGVARRMAYTLWFVLADLVALGALRLLADVSLQALRPSALRRRLKQLDRRPRTGRATIIWRDPGRDQALRRITPR